MTDEERVAEEARIAEEAEAAEIAGEGNPAGLGEDQVIPPEDEADFEAEGKKRGYKNLILENKRKGEELAQIKREREDAQVSEAKAKEAAKSAADETKAGKPLEDRAPAKVKAYIKQMRDLGHDDEFINAQVDLMGYMASDIASEKIRPAEKFIYKSDLDNTISRLTADDKYKFAVGKLEKELRAELGKYDPKYWGDTDLVKSVLGKLALENAEIFAGSGKKIIAAGGDVEAGRSGAHKGTGETIDEAAFKQFVEQMGFETSTPALKAKAVEAFKKLSQLNKNQ